jgi:type I restriction-modification system DNA methylase subunit
MTQLNLQQAYSRQNWQNWLTEIFGSQIQFETQAENVDIDHDNIKSVQRFASVKLADGKTLAVFDIETLAGVQISRNRVGLRNLVEKFIDHARYHGILAFYHSDTLVEYRMSFISNEPKIDDSGNFVIEHTSPKRYTYLLGKNAKTKTPADRLNIIAAKQGTATLEDITKAFSVETLAKEFYAELFAWYQWALSGEIGVTFPNEFENKKIDEHLIRLITRLMFVWFIKQKNLVPETIFDIDKLKSILKNFNATDSEQDNYYRAILQNLFFATLNNKIEDRNFAVDGTYHENRVQYGIKTLYRYTDDFSISNDEVVKLFGNVPFLNGGLFECLDKDTSDSNGKIVYCDGFSRRKDKQFRAHIPNVLFFDKDKGIIPLLGKYNFTIEENTSDDVNVALDPELLGKVFENLLGTYNPETKETARKQSGSFYTPREIVNYMVDESLIAYLKRAVGEQHEDVFRKLFNEKLKIEGTLKKQIYEALRNGKILDPACGSGAFPMGILNRIICMMENLDYSHSIFELKLHLIENCIYGVDIQSIAVQISKLRFFISLICEQTPNKDIVDNFGIKPLPNLETKFVAANTLIGLDKKKEGDFTADLFEDPQIEVTKKSLLEIRHLHFSADTAKKKKEYRSKDKELREKLASFLEANNDFAPEDAKQLALWNPYDQNASSPFFDMEWMFGLKEGFDIVIGNPPYVQLQNNGGELAEKYAYSKKEQKIKKQESPYKTFARTGDIYCLFYERGWQLLKSQGHLCYITSNKWMRAGYGENTRKFFSENTNPEQL